jgi:hypothetical protein
MYAVQNRVKESGICASNYDRYAESAEGRRFAVDDPDERRDL